jgi:hypothetical protein
MLAAIRALNCSERMIRSGRDGRLVEPAQGASISYQVGRPNQPAEEHAAIAHNCA